MGITGAENRSGIIKVEQIAGTLIVQHYETRLAQPKHVTFVSEGHMAPWNDWGAVGKGGCARMEIGFAQ